MILNTHLLGKNRRNRNMMLSFQPDYSCSKKPTKTIVLVYLYIHFCSLIGATWKPHKYHSLQFALATTSSQDETKWTGFTAAETAAFYLIFFENCSFFSSLYHPTAIFPDNAITTFHPTPKWMGRAAISFSEGL